GADFADLAQRHGRFRDVDDQRFRAGAGNRKDISLIADLRKRPFAVRADAHVVSGIPFGMFGSWEPGFAGNLENRATVGAVVAEGDQTVFGVNVDAVGLRSEVRMRGAARRKNKIDVAAFRGQPDEIEVDRRGAPLIELLDMALARAAQRDDAL